MEIKNRIDDNELSEIFNISKEQFGSESWTMDQFKSSFLSPTSIFIVAKDTNITSFLVAQDCIDNIDLLLIATRETEKRKGFASALIDELGKYQKPIFLEVRKNNLPAKRLYESEGFNLISERKKYYKDGQSALIYQKK